MLSLALLAWRGANRTPSLLIQWSSHCYSLQIHQSCFQHSRNGHDTRYCRCLCHLCLLGVDVERRSHRAWRRNCPEPTKTCEAHTIRHREISRSALKHQAGNHKGVMPSSALCNLAFGLWPQKLHSTKSPSSNPIALAWWSKLWLSNKEYISHSTI